MLERNQTINDQERARATTEKPLNDFISKDTNIQAVKLNRSASGNNLTTLSGYSGKASNKDNFKDIISHTDSTAINSNFSDEHQKKGSTGFLSSLRNLNVGGRKSRTLSSKSTGKSNTTTDESVDEISELGKCSPPAVSSSTTDLSNASRLKALPKISSLFRQTINNNTQQQIPPKSSAMSLSVQHLISTNSGKTRSISAQPIQSTQGLNHTQKTASGLVLNSTTNHAHNSSSLVGTHLGASNKQAALSAYDMHQPTKPKLYHLEDFHIVKRVGKGGFASVYLVRLKTSSGRYWALKVIKKQEVVRLKQEKQILNEKNILKEITHPYIVELVQTFQDPQYLYMVLEYVAGGDLFTYLRKVQRFTEDESTFYVAEVLLALEYLHSIDVVYRDLKPENILLDSTGHIKLADFGFAKVVKAVTSSFCGTPDYIAPEIVIGRPYTKAVDCWSLGVLIFELTSGKTPFGDETSEQIYDNIQTGKIKFNTYILGACKDIICCLLQVDYRNRLGSVLAQGGGGAKDIRRHPYFAKINWAKLEIRHVTPPYIPVFDAPEKLEKQKPSSRRDEVLESLKPGGSNWLSGDPFHEIFKDF